MNTSSSRPTCTDQLIKEKKVKRNKYKPKGFKRCLIRSNMRLIRPIKLFLPQSILYVKSHLSLHQPHIQHIVIF